jgi:predicted TIM-barrel fold metal-dependent hydrolase
VHYGRSADEIPEPGVPLDVTRSRRARQALGIDYQVVFPTPMLLLGLHPDPQVEKELAWAYSRWFTEEILPHDPGIKHLVYLPFHDPEASLRAVERFADVPGVIGFTVTSTRYAAVHDNQYMRLYDALQERDMPLAFHAAFNQQERMFEGMNRFLSVHALGFVVNTLVHATNIVINGILERFPALRVIWVESGLAWVPFLMQRLDDEYMKRTNEAPLLRARPSEYMAERFYYTSQPIELEHREALALTMKMIRAETQLLYASDYPHWDFDLPSTIYDLPFLSEDAKRSILGANALRVFPKLAAELTADGGEPAAVSRATEGGRAPPAGRAASCAPPCARRSCRTPRSTPPAPCRCSSSPRRACPRSAWRSR